jgi:hypothetical protein
MSDFDIDPEVIGTLPGGLRERRAGLVGATTLPAPDTGASTPATLVAVQRISGRATALADGLGGLADRVDASLAAYADSDGEVRRVFGDRLTWEPW